jgi:hypothetical protein
VIVLYGRLLAPNLRGHSAWGFAGDLRRRHRHRLRAYRFAVKLLLKKVRAEDVFAPLSSRRKGTVDVPLVEFLVDVAAVFTFP